MPRRKKTDKVEALVNQLIRKGKGFIDAEIVEETQAEVEERKEHLPFGEQEQ